MSCWEPTICPHREFRSINDTHQGRPLFIGIVNDSIPGAIHFNRIGSKKPGYFVEITKLICSNLDYNCYFKRSSSNVYSKLINGSIWAGMLGDIDRGVYDTSLPNFTPTAERLDHFDFCTNVIRFPLVFATRTPNDEDSYNLTALLKTLSVNVWLILILASITLTSIIVISQSVLRSNNSSIIYQIAITLISVAVFLARKGPQLSSTNRVIRLLLVFWGLAMIIVISSYSAGLLASMFRKAPKLPFNNLETLVSCIMVKKCRMVFTPSGDWFLNKVLTSRENSNYYRLKLALAENPIERVETTAEAIKLVRLTTDTFIVTWPAQRERFVAEMDINCSITLVDHNSDILIDTFAFRQGDQLKWKFDRQFQLLYDSGILSRIIAEYPINDGCKSRLKSTKAVPIPLRVLLGGIFILVIGIFLSFFSFAIEKCSIYCNILS